MNASVYCPGISGIALSGVRLSAESHQGGMLPTQRSTSSNPSPHRRTAICRWSRRVAFGRKGSLRLAALRPVAAPRAADI